MTAIELFPRPGGFAASSCHLRPLGRQTGRVRLSSSRRAEPLLRWSTREQDGSEGPVQQVVRRTSSFLLLVVRMLLVVRPGAPSN